MFARRLMIMLGGFLAIAICIFALTSVAEYKPYGVPDALRDQWEAKQDAIRAANEARVAKQAMESGEQVAVELPAAAIEVREHDFGLLDPGQQATHTFTIENRGNAPLALVAADTSCKCTLSKTSRDMVPPGESADITLTWNTGSEREFYRQYAVVRTNDPEHPEIELAVTGRIRTLLGFDVEQFQAGDVQPGSGAEAEAVLFSQVLDDFEVASVESDLPGFHAEILPVLDETLEVLKAKSAWRIRVTTDASLNPGPFSDLVRVRVRGDVPEIETAEETLVRSDAGVGEELLRELPIAGTVRSSISFYGAGLDSRDGLDLGVVTNDRELVHRLYVRTRGNPAPEKLVVSGVEPKALRATIAPVTSRPGVFQLTIRIPAGSEQVIFNRESQHGYVEVSDAENPSQKNWFPVKGAVVDMNQRP